MQKLYELCKDKATGTLFITTYDNHSIRFFLEQGKIFSLAYRFKYGNDALHLIKKITSGRLAFRENVLLGGRNDLSLLDTDSLLKTLLGRGGLAPAVKEKAEATISLHAEIKHLKTELSMFIGPIASFICDDYIKHHGEPHSLSELKRMMEVISQEIGDQEKEEMFKKMELH
jgi:hypothetical protein